MRVPAQAQPVQRRPALRDPDRERGILPSTGRCSNCRTATTSSNGYCAGVCAFGHCAGICVCGACQDHLGTVIELVGKAGCAGGVAAFEAICNAALDIETLGAGAIICGAVGVGIGWACNKYGAAYLVSHSQQIAQEVCTNTWLCSAS